MGVGRFLSGTARCAVDERRLSTDQVRPRLLGLRPHRPLSESIEHEGIVAVFVVDLVFTTWRGKPLRNLNFRRDVFDRAADDAGLHGLTPHELRHTAASLAVSAGANVKAVQRMLGHASAAMILEVYSGLFDDDLDGVAERLDQPGGPRRWWDELA